ncbi:MAG: hypothetical protein R3Y21_05220 [Mycoplasmatota bacterium]
MSKGKVTLLFTASNYNDELKINMKVLLKRKLPGTMKQSNDVAYKFPVKKGFKSTGTYLTIFANKEKFNEFSIPARNKTTTLYIDDFEAEFLKVKTKAGDRYYHVVVVNLGTTESPILRSFYIDDDYINLAVTQKFQYENTFTEVEGFTETEELDEDLEESNQE